MESGINHLFDSMWKGITPDSPVVAHEIPEEPLDEYSYYKGDFIDLKEAKLNKGWKYVPSWRGGNLRRSYVSGIPYRWNRDSCLSRCEVPVYGLCRLILFQTYIPKGYKDICSIE